MGAWDATSFGNDTASDWAYDLGESDGLPYLEKTIQAVLDTGDEYLDSDIASEGIAAAEVVALLLGKPAPATVYTDAVETWVSANPTPPSPTLVQKALSALDRIQREPSELPELWEDDPDWIDSMRDLRARLTS